MKSCYDTIDQKGDILAVNKKPFVYTAFFKDTHYPSLERELYHHIKKDYEVIYPLELLTSGVVLLSHDAHLLNQMRDSLNKGEWNFTYDLIVKAPVFFEKETLIKPLSFKTKKIQIEEGAPLFSVNFEVVYKYRDFAHIKAKTTNPISFAVLFLISFLGSSAMGDKTYGLKEIIYLSNLKKRQFKVKKDEDEKPLTLRPLIHLTQASHPNFGEFNASFSKDFRSVLDKLDKYNRFIEEGIFLQEILDSIASKKGDE